MFSNFFILRKLIVWPKGRPWPDAPLEYVTDNTVNMLAGLYLSLYSPSEMWSLKWKMLSPKFQIVELIESMKYSWIAYGEAR